MSLNSIAVIGDFPSHIDQLGKNFLVRGLSQDFFIARYYFDSVNGIIMVRILVWIVLES